MSVFCEAKIVTESANLDVAVLIPCLNEGRTIGEVVKQFKSVLPSSTVYVYDNGSTDDTVPRSLQAGALVFHENTRGKGNVVRRMFADVKADFYLMLDGDGTYDPSDAPLLLNELVEGHLDMVVGSRSKQKNARRGHNIGNRMFTFLYGWLFGRGFSDIFSGYRAFSDRFVHSFPAVSSGFEIETEMSVHASQLGLPVAEVDISYEERIEGSDSKLRTYVDGWRILWAMLVLLKNNRPLALFGSLSVLSFLLAALFGIPIIVDFSQTGLVEKLPTAVLASGLAVAGLVQLALGLILESLSRARIEIKRLSYLNS